jgi:tRNA 2-thiouridine synthesizing protein B
MTTLHLVRRSAFETNDFAQCLNTTTNKDCLILLDDGCYNLHHTLLKSAPCAVKAIKEQVLARGISVEQQANTVKLISMAALVELTFGYQKTITWQ